MVKKLIHYLYQALVPARFRAHWKHKGNNVHVDYKTSVFVPFNHISLGDNVYIGPRALFYCTGSQIIIWGGDNWSLSHRYRW